MIIYKTTNLVSGKIYVGKDVSNNPKYLGSGLILKRAITKYGMDNFKKETLEKCLSLKELAKKEVIWIERLNATNRKIGYNITTGGEGGDTFSNQLEAKKKKILEKRKKSSREIFESEEYREKLSKATKKTWQNPAHKKLITDLMTGRKIKWKAKISKSIKEWHKTNSITSAGIEKMREAGRKTRGREIKSISPQIEAKIVELYQIIGPKRIAEKLDGKVSRFLVIRLLKKKGIYQKWQKGIGKA